MAAIRGDSRTGLYPQYNPTCLPRGGAAIAMAYDIDGVILDRHLAVTRAASPISTRTLGAALVRNTAR